MCWQFTNAFDETQIAHNTPIVLSAEIQFRCICHICICHALVKIHKHMSVFKKKSNITFLSLNYSHRR